jgi:hypothetical protein
LSAECIFIVLAPSFLPFLPGIPYSASPSPARPALSQYTSFPAMHYLRLSFPPSRSRSLQAMLIFLSADYPLSGAVFASWTYLPPSTMLYRDSFPACADSSDWESSRSYRNYVGCLWRFVLTDAIAGADVGEYSAPLPALVHVHPPPLPSIVITPPFPSPSCSPFVSTVLTFPS